MTHSQICKPMATKEANAIKKKKGSVPNKASIINENKNIYLFFVFKEH